MKNKTKRGFEHLLISSLWTKRILQIYLSQKHIWSVLWSEDFFFIVKHKMQLQARLQREKRKHFIILDAH